MSIYDTVVLRRCQDQVPLEACQHYLSSFRSTPFSRGGGLSLTHGDLYPEHILFDRNRRRIVGIIDWADATFTDPAIDLAGAVYWGGLTFAEEVLRATDARLDGGTMERAGFYAVCRALSDVKYGSHPQNAPYLSAAIAVLQRPESLHRQ